MNQSNEQFRRTLDERHSVVKGLALQLVTSGPALTLEQNGERANEFCEACNHMDAILSNSDKPAWLAQAIQKSRQFATHRRNDLAGQFFVWLNQHFAQMQKPVVILETEAVDFDKDYSDVRDSFGIPELFDKLVDALGRIIALDVIDSSAVKDALQKLKAVLASNRKGSQGAIFATMNYVELVQRIISGYANKIGGPAFEAFDETYTEAKQKVEEVNLEYRRKSLDRLVDEKALKRFIASGVVETEELLGALPAGLLDAPKDEEVEIEEVEKAE